MTVELSAFEARVVRAALTEYALMLEPATSRIDENGHRMPIDYSAFMVADTANGLNERLEKVLNNVNTSTLVGHGLDSESNRV